jgi:hypothetical protein
MTDSARVGTATVPHFLLVWRPPSRSGPFVVGGWALESWRGGVCSWAVELAGLGACFWSDAELAKVVAARVLRGRRLPDPLWRPGGGDGGPVFLAGAPPGARPDPPVPPRPAAADAPFGLPDQAPVT